MEKTHEWGNLTKTSSTEGHNYCVLCDMIVEFNLEFYTFYRNSNPELKITIHKSEYSKNNSIRRCNVKLQTRGEMLKGKKFII